MRFFVSYSRKDKEFLQKIVDHLGTTYGEENIWYDKRLEPGIRWREKIEEEIKKCDIAICLLSEDFVKSSNCSYEIEKIREYGKYIIPILVRQFDVPDELANFQYMDMTEGANWESSAKLHAIIYRHWNNIVTTTAPKKPRRDNNTQVTQEVGISRIYPNRDSARQDILNDLLNPEVREIRISGISLNDFLDDKGHHYNSWLAFKDYLQRYEGTSKLNVKILIVHPLTFGAQLREWSEVQDDEFPRLTKDVNSLAPILEKLANQLKEKTSHINFEVRMYLTAPILFLIHTDKVCYVQQYHFWPTRKSKINIPVLQYLKASKDGRYDDMHSHMAAHFDWIWEKASVPAFHFLRAHNVGVDQGIGRSGIINIFTQPSEGKERILYLLKQARERIFIQGITLHTFFQNDEQITETIRDLVRSDAHVDIKVLLLDPECDQAIFRSYREYCIRSGAKHSLMSFREYQEEAHGPNKAESYHRKQSDLYLHTISSKNVLLDINNIAQDKNAPFDFRFYDSAPGSFVLIVDDHALVEQYHFGKLQRHNEFILGKDMPLVEYKRDYISIFNEHSNRDHSQYQHRDPYRLIEDHLLFVIDNFSWPATLPRQTKSDPQ